MTIEWRCPWCGNVYIEVVRLAASTFVVASRYCVGCEADHPVQQMVQIGPKV